MLALQGKINLGAVNFTQKRVEVVAVNKDPGFDPFKAAEKKV